MIKPGVTSAAEPSVTQLQLSVEVDIHERDHQGPTEVCGKREMAYHTLLGDYTATKLSGKD